MELFVWMFKKEDFKKHYIYLASGTALLILFAGIVNTAVFFLQGGDVVINNVLYIIGAVSCLLPAFFPTGYFWNLTNNIINREADILASNVYNGKIKRTYKIELPELNFMRFIWRGFASVVASVLMLVPYLLIVMLNFKRAGLETQTGPAFTAAYILYALLIPALLWNYARQNSVIASLNIRKAVYIVGNYPFRYMKNIIILALITFINSIFDGFFINMAVSCFAKGLNILTILSLLGIIGIMIFIIAKNFYMLFVTAYLLGTLAETTEA